MNTFFQQFKNKKVLVTGGSGFIGQNLINRLNKLGSDVFNYDSSRNYDISDKKKLSSIIAKKFDIIFHLAGLSGSITKDDSYLKINMLGALFLCQSIVKHSPKSKLIISSSRLEYGTPHYLPVDEDHPTLPTSIYGLSKLASTQIALLYAKAYKLDTIIFRTSNVYGPHSKKIFSGYNIVNYFIDEAIRGANLTIFGSGTQERDYIYIDDFIDVFLLAAVSKRSGQIYNLGLGKGIKIKDMAKIIVKAAKNGRIIYKQWPTNYKQVETGSYVSNITKVKKDLGFMPKIDIEKGVLNTLKLEIIRQKRTHLWREN